MEIDPNGQYTTGEVARYFGKSVAAVNDWCRRGVLRAWRPGPTGQWTIRGDAILEFQQRGYNTPGPPPDHSW